MTNGGDSSAATAALDDLISDAELVDPNEDSFGHATIVAQLEALICNRDLDRAINVALYGPWGSGKSSVAAQLQRAFAASDRIEFVRFDAFKYAQSSLHRHFLAEMARALPPAPASLRWYQRRPKKWVEWRRKKAAATSGTTAEKRRRERFDASYRQRLYQSTQRKSLTMAKGDGWRLIGAVFKFVFVPTVLIALLGAVLWALFFSPASFSVAFKGALPDTLTLLVVPAAAGLFAVFRELLPTSASMSEPSSSEQFEAMFAELVHQSGKDRVVVFVDEIDRCAPTEVVETLDTIRTFLGVPPCVFIVAADQQVLEQAISLEVRQTTPDNATNPYYSGGSAYLDKVFQYQFSLPPLLSTTVSQYALDLVKPLPGVWEQVDVDDVVSLLIPTHVRSPRRVKALLNNYVLTYRLAESAGLIGPASKAGSTRDTELAVMVCLKSEFPLFYRDLAQHPALPRLLRYIHDVGVEHAEQPESARDTSWQRALAYENGSAVADQILPDGPPADAASGAAAPARAAASLNNELREYLLKSGDAREIGTDLIFMISSDGFYDLDPTEAEALAAMAVNQDKKGLLAAIAGASEEDRERILRFLAHRTRGGSVGSEGANMASSLLAVSGEYLSKPGLVANDVARAIAAQQAKRDLKDGDIPGALRVGLLSTAGDAADLIAEVFQLRRHRYVPQITAAILAAASELWPLHERDLADVFAWGVVQGDVDLAVITGALPADELAELTETAIPVLAEIIDELEAGTWGTDDDDADPDQQDELRQRLAALLNAMADAGAGDAAQNIARALYETGREPEIGIVFENLGALGPAATESVVDMLHKACQERTIDELGAWFEAAHGPGLENGQRHDLHRDVLLRLWESRSERGTPGFDEALARLAGQRAGESLPAVPSAELLDGTVSVTSLSDATVGAIDGEFRHLEAFAEAGLLPDAAEVFAEPVQQVLDLPNPAPSPIPSPDSVALVEEWLGWLAVRSDTDQIAALVARLEASPWFPWETRERIAFELAGPAGVPAPKPTSDLRLQLKDAPASPEYAGALLAWVTFYAPTPEDMWEVFGAHAWDPLPPDLREVLIKYASTATPAQIAELTEPMVRRLPATPTADSYLTACSYSKAAPGPASTTLAAAAKAAAAKPGTRKFVLDTWLTFAPTDPEARTRLLQEIAIPFASRAREAAETLVSAEYENLLKDPPAQIRTRLRDTLTGKVKGTPGEAAMKKRLQELGITDKPKAGALKAMQKGASAAFDTIAGKS